MVLVTEDGRFFRERERERELRGRCENGRFFREREREKVEREEDVIVNGTK